MRIAVLLVCVAVATASYIPDSYKQHNAKWNEELSSKHDYNKGNHDGYTSGAKDSHADHVTGGDNFSHKEHFTATKHNLVKGKHVVNHNSDDNKAVVNHNAFGQGYGASYKTGGSKSDSNSGKNGKVEHTVHQVANYGNQGYQGYPGYGHGPAYGAYGNKASDAKHSQFANSWATYGASDSDKQGAHQGQVAGYGNNGDAYDRYVKHNEVHTNLDEDYAHKDVLQEANRHSNFQKADAAFADKGQKHVDYDQATGHASQWSASSGHKDDADHSHGKGGHSGQQSSHSYAAGKSHQDHNAKNGGLHESHDNAANKQGSSYDTHSDNKNVYNIKTKKVHNVESVVDHADGFSKDNFGDYKFDQAKYGFDSDWYKTNRGAKKDNSYNNYNAHHSAQFYQPHPPSYFGYHFG